MSLGKLGQAQAARGIFDLVQNDLEQVEKKISAESVASVDAVTAVGRYLQSAGGKRLRPALLVMDDVLTLDRPAVFHAAKDRPILFSALAWADVLLTLDRGDFGGLMDKPFYGLLVFKPGVFLERERSAGRLK